MSKKKHTDIEFTDDVFAAIFPEDPGRAALLKLRSETLLQLRRIVGAWEGTQADKAQRLHIQQPRFHLLMNNSKTDGFSLDQLVKLTAIAGATPTIRFNEDTANNGGAPSARPRLRAAA